MNGRLRTLLIVVVGGLLLSGAPRPATEGAGLAAREASPARPAAMMPAQGGRSRLSHRTDALQGQGEEDASNNWAGYVVATDLDFPASGAVSDVRGEWTVPTVRCGKGEAASSVWVGIGGYADDGLEQIGTAQSCVAGQADYYAWYESLPAPEKPIDLEVNPGDVIRAEVHYAGHDAFVLTLTDATTGERFRITQRAKVQRESAEWIAEAPSALRPHDESGASGRVQAELIPLANFGAVTFRGCAVTLDGRTGPIGAAGRYARTTMATAGGTVKARPSALTAGGRGFRITWTHR